MALRPPILVGPALYTLQGERLLSFGLVDDVHPRGGNNLPVPPHSQGTAERSSSSGPCAARVLSVAVSEAPGVTDKWSNALPLFYSLSGCNFQELSEGGNNDASPRAEP
jgi:hypothetical protein